MKDAIASYLAQLSHGGMVQSNHLCGSGAVAELEGKLKNFYGVRYALCVSSATTGLLAIALALNLRRCEFITTPYTYGGSLASWLLLGSRPVFSDIETVTLTADLDSLRKRVTARTKAILAVDIFGNPADTVALRKLADEMGLWYIADAAQSFGAFQEGLPASQLADAFVISFTTGKQIFAGEGGAILTNHKDIYQKLVWYSQHPYRQRRDISLQFDNEFGINGRIHPLAAVWANAVFEDSLVVLSQHQAECLRIIEVLNSTRLTEEIDFKRRGILPAFFRLTAAWRGKPQPSKLLECLEENGIRVRLAPAPIHLVYKQAAFAAQYGRRLKMAQACPQAECQSAKRFCLMK